MKISRRDRSCSAAIAAPLAAQLPRRLQTWPSGIIRIIVPFPPGGTTDPIVRMVQPGLQKRLKRNLDRRK